MKFQFIEDTALEIVDRAYNTVINKIDVNSSSFNDKEEKIIKEYGIENLLKLIKYHITEDYLSIFAVLHNLERFSNNANNPNKTDETMSLPKLDDLLEGKTIKSVINLEILLIFIQGYTLQMELNKIDIDEKETVYDEVKTLLHDIDHLDYISSHYKEFFKYRCNLLLVSYDTSSLFLSLPELRENISDFWNFLKLKISRESNVGSSIVLYYKVLLSNYVILRYELLAFEEPIAHYYNVLTSSLNQFNDNNILTAYHAYTDYIIRSFYPDLAITILNFDDTDGERLKSALFSFVENNYYVKSYETLLELYQFSINIHDLDSLTQISEKIEKFKAEGKDIPLYNITLSIFEMIRNYFEGDNLKVINIFETEIIDEYEVISPYMFVIACFYFLSSLNSIKLLSQNTMAVDKEFLKDQYKTLNHCQYGLEHRVENLKRRNYISSIFLLCKIYVLKLKENKSIDNLLKLNEYIEIADEFIEANHLDNLSQKLFMLQIKVTTYSIINDPKLLEDVTSIIDRFDELQLSYNYYKEKMLFYAIKFRLRIIQKDFSSAYDVIQEIKNYIDDYNVEIPDFVKNNVLEMEIELNEILHDITSTYAKAKLVSKDMEQSALENFFSNILLLENN